MRVLVTGATGFIGRAFVPFARAKGWDAIAPSKTELQSTEPWLRGTDAVLHLAAIADTSGVDAAAYQAVNRDLPVSIAKKARDLGVKRFVFVSSSHAVTHAETPYGASKAAAERELMALAEIEMVIARPTLVYGAEAQGNFAALLILADTPLPLPLGVSGRRSMVHIDNLVAALAFLLTAPNVDREPFFISDPGPPPSVGEIVSLLRRGMGRRPPILFSAPWLPGLLTALGKKPLADKLFGSQVVDGTPLIAAGWQPSVSTEEGLRGTAREARGRHDRP